MPEKHEGDTSSAMWSENLRLNRGWSRENRNNSARKFGRPSMRYIYLNYGDKIEKYNLSCNALYGVDERSETKIIRHII